MSFLILKNKNCTLKDFILECALSYHVSGEDGKLPDIESLKVDEYYEDYAKTQLEILEKYKKLSLKDAEKQRHKLLSEAIKRYKKAITDCKRNKKNSDKIRKQLKKLEFPESCTELRKTCFSEIDNFEKRECDSNFYEEELLNLQKILKKKYTQEDLDLKIKYQELAYDYADARFKSSKKLIDMTKKFVTDLRNFLKN